MSNKDAESAKATPLGMRNKIVQKPKNTFATIKRLLQYLKNSTLLITIAMIIAILGTLMQVVTPKLLGNATTLIYNGTTTAAGIDFDALLSILLLVAGLYAGTCITGFLQQWIMAFVAQKVTFVLRNEIKEKMNTVPIAYFDKHTNGNLMSIAMNDMDNIASTLQESLTRIISSIIMVTGIFWIMTTISWVLTAVTCIIIPASYIIMRFLSTYTQKNYREYVTLQGELNGHIEETYNNHAVLKVFNGEQAALNKFETYNTVMYQSGWKAKFFGGSGMPSMMIMKNLIYVIIAVIGAAKVATGTVVIGDLQAFLHYSTQFSQPVIQFSHIWNSILSTISSAERVFEILDAPDIKDAPDVTNIKDTRNITEIKDVTEILPQNTPTPPCSTENAAKISFSHVKFGYEKFGTIETMLINDFNLIVQPGQMVAIVGHTGAGKSTLINLIERFYEIKGGSICINGINIAQLSYKELRSQIGMVLQDTWLFSGSIYDNIQYGNVTAPPEAVYAAAKAAYVDDFTRKLPLGYHTLLNEEASNISQGQRQLITIARAFVADPDILILDEATSNVDSRTEMLIQKAMRRLLQNRTSFVVAHRLSTIYDADNIIVMADGNIAETGTHQELLAKNGVYADIYNSQFAPPA